VQYLLFYAEIIDKNHKNRAYADLGHITVIENMVSEAYPISLIRHLFRSSSLLICTPKVTPHLHPSLLNTALEVLILYLWLLFCPLLATVCSLSISILSSTMVLSLMNNMLLSCTLLILYCFCKIYHHFCCLNQRA